VQVILGGALAVRAGFRLLTSALKRFQQFFLLAGENVYKVFPLAIFRRAHLSSKVNKVPGLSRKLLRRNHNHNAGAAIAGRLAFVRSRKRNLSE